jgi:hypothetical protein
MLVSSHLEDATKLHKVTAVSFKLLSELRSHAWELSAMLTLGRGCGLGVTNLLWEHMGAEVLQRQLELLGLAAEQDLDHDGRVQSHGHVGGRHGGQVRLINVISDVGGYKAAAASSLPQWSTKGVLQLVES